MDRDDLWVIHLDMDAFFAAVEQRDNPRLRGRPVIVGGPPHSRGVVATASYEARKFGVHSAMPSREAVRLCPQAIFIQPSHGKYTEVSNQIRAIMARYSAKIEPLSVDEAFLDVSGEDAIALGKRLKEDIRRELRLTGSVGVSYCKFLAKLGSDMQKPDGFTVIDRARAAQLLPGLPVRKLYGVGPRSDQTLAALGIKTCADLLKADIEVVRRHFGRRADELVALARGIDPRPVATNNESKSIGEENTFAQDQTDRAHLEGLLEEYAGRLARDLKAQGLACRTVTVKIKWDQFVPEGPRGGDFLAITRSHTMAGPSEDPVVIAETARDLFRRVDWEGRKVRLLGLSVSNFARPGDLIQLRLPL